MHAADFTAYRLVVEGWGVEAVTDPSMETVTTDGVSRIAGLLRDGLAVEESVDIARGQVESSGFTAQIVDRQYDEVWTEFCARQPSTRTWLTADIDATSDPVTIDVDSSAGFASGDYFHIGTECLRVSSVPDATSIFATRARRKTTMQAHYTEDGENLTRPVITHTYPISLEGRRVFLYEYIEGEHDFAGEGDLVWRGIAATDTNLDDNGAVWSLLVDSIYTLLKQDIGGDTEGEFSLRGYYYSAQKPLGLSVFRFDPASSDFPYPSESTSWDVAGHFETVEDLVAEVNATLPAAVATFANAHMSGSFEAITFEDGSWGVTFQTDGTETESLGINAGGAEYDLGGAAQNRAIDEIVSGAGRHVFAFARPMIAPRGVWGPHDGAALVTPTDDNDATNIFPDSLILLNVGDVLTVQTGEEGDPVSYEVTAEDDTERRYQISGPVRESPYFTPDTVPRFSKHTSYVRNGTLADFRDALVANAPLDANRGAGPFVTANDLADWGPAVARAARTAGPLVRRHFIAAQAIKLDEMLASECQLLGLFPRLDSELKINLGHLELPTATTPVNVELDDSNIIISNSPPRWERNAINGSINTVELHTGYNPQEDEHTGPVYRTRDVTAISTYKKTKQLTIEPKSMDAGTFNDRDATNAFRRVLGVFGRPYSVIRLNVAYTLRSSIFCGSFVSITNSHIPNVVTGQRGVTDVKGVVIRRAWDMSMPYGEVTVMVSDAQLLGYTPTVSVSGSSGGGTSYTLDVNTSDPTGTFVLAPPSLTPDLMFPIGTRVELMEWDTFTQVAQPGVVTASTATTITVDFDAAPTLTGTRYLRYGSADVVTEAAQRQWAYMANASSQVEYSTGDEVAAEFAA